MDILQMIKNGGNPQAIAMNLLQQSNSNNPIMANLISMIQNNDTQGSVQLATNYLKEQGRDFNKEFDEFMKAVGRK